MKYYKTIILGSVLLLLSSCGNDEIKITRGSSDDNSMELHKAYTLKEGDKIIRNDKDTVLSLEADIETGITIAILEKGSADLIQD